MTVFITVLKKNIDNEKSVQVAMLPQTNNNVKTTKEKVPTSVNASLINRNPVNLPISFASDNTNKKNINQESSKEKSKQEPSVPINNIKVEDLNTSEIEIAKLSDDIDNSPKESSLDEKEDNTSSYSDNHQKSPDNPATDFWNSLLLKGDQIAATIGNSDNYSNNP